MNGRVVQLTVPSYLAPILKSVGITAPIQITLINAGLGKIFLDSWYIEGPC